MKDEFKAGDLVFEVNPEHISLEKIKNFKSGTFPLMTERQTYTLKGCVADTYKHPNLFHATPENRAALVTLYGEENVPQLPYQGSELAKKLVSKTPHICMVSNNGDDYASNCDIRLVVEYDKYDEVFHTSDGAYFENAVPIDNNGNEIMGLDDE